MSEWIDWKGGERPVVAGTKVRVRLRNGLESPPRSAELFHWMPSASDGAVVAYQVVDEAQRPAAARALDVQVSGDHYKSMAIQPVEFIHANNIPYLEGNVIKYVARWRSKGGIADLEKAKHYIDLLIELEGKRV